MLFHPRQPRGFGIFKIQGIFPKRQKALARKLGDLVADNILNKEDLKQEILYNPSVDEEIKKMLESYLDNFLRNKLLKFIPMAAMFVTDTLIETVKQNFFEDWETRKDEIKNLLADKFLGDLDIKLLVRQKVEDFSSEKLEEVLFSILSKEFRFIENLGAVFGFFIGLVQAFAFSFF